MSKYKKIFIIFIIFFYQSLYAESSATLNANIKRLLQEIKKAPKSKKRVLINRLKRDVRKLNRLKRTKIIKKIKASLSNNRNRSYHKRVISKVPKNNLNLVVDIKPIIPKIKKVIIKEIPTVEKSPIIEEPKIDVEIERPIVETPTVENSPTIEQQPKVDIEIERPIVDNPHQPNNTMNQHRIRI